MWETWILSLGWEDPLEEGMATHCSILAWRIAMDKRTLAGYNPWGHQESDMTDNPLQYSCLKNPIDKRNVAGYSPWCHNSWTRFSD